MRTYKYGVMLAALAAVGLLACSDDDGGTGNNNNTQVTCGDGVAAGTETCDGADLRSNSCTSIGEGFTGGVLACNATCTDWDTSACTGGTDCGNGAVDPGEACDTTNVLGYDCTTVPGGSFDGGTLACLSDCSDFDTSGCTTGGSCGDDTIDTGEVCDGADLDGYDCTTVPGGSFDGGTLACQNDCSDFDTSGCTGGTDCGNGTIDTGEECDGNNLDGNDCTTLGVGYTGGTLACDNSCAFDTSACTGAAGATCGTPVDISSATFPYQALGTFDDDPATGFSCAATPTNVIWYQFTAQTTATYGIAAVNHSTTDPYSRLVVLDGTSCNPYDAELLCEEVSAASITAQVALTAGSTYLFAFFTDDDPYTMVDPEITVEAMSCGDGVATGSELCDGNDLNNNDCTTIGMGFSGGTLGCNANCMLWDYSQCTTSIPVCGNNLAEAGEECDGADMGGATGVACTDLGFTGGTITCTAGCRYDLTTCTGGPAGWTCQADYYNDGLCDCGCGVVDPDCADSTAASCEYCDDIGGCNGYAACPGIINPTNNATCTATTCGDNVAQGLEQCDGTDTRGLTCADLVPSLPGGTLGCTACSFDFSGCQAATCGDGVAAGAEQCDGADLGGNTCSTLGLGFQGGTLTCTASCAYDTSQCVSQATCGDGTVGGSEQCDGADLGGATGVACTDLGFTGGTITCTAGCLWDLTTCTGGTPGWTCPMTYYNASDGCDCGCGVVDPDCADATVGSCDYCDDAGSCSTATSGCPGDIDPTDNTQCI